MPWICCPRMSGENLPRLWRNILTNLRTLTEKASELGAGAKESMDDLGRSAGRKLAEAREETGDALHSAASSVRATGDAIDNFATGTADRLDATASYVEDRDLKGVFTDLRRFGRRHLTGSLVAAVGIGFLAGSAWNRATHSSRRAHKNT